MPELTDAQIIAALDENGHGDEAEALAEKIKAADADKPANAKPSADGAGLGGVLRRAAGGR